VANLPFEQFGQLWKEYVNKFAECLLEARGDASTPAAQRLGRLCFEIGMLKSCVALSHPKRVWSFILDKFEEQQARGKSFLYWFF
jgi:hypothetical protein